MSHVKAALAYPAFIEGYIAPPEAEQELLAAGLHKDPYNGRWYEAGRGSGLGGGWGSEGPFGA